MFRGLFNRGFLSKKQKDDPPLSGREQKTALFFKRAESETDAIKTSGSLLTTLPDDVILHLGSLLNGKSLGRCLCVCKELKRIFTNEEFWQVRCKRIAENSRLPGKSWRLTYSTRLRLWERWRRGQYDKTEIALPDAQRIEKIHCVPAYDGEFVVVADVSRSVKVFRFSSKAEGCLEQKVLDVSSGVVATGVEGSKLVVGASGGVVKVFDVLSGACEMACSATETVTAVTIRRDAVLDREVTMVAAGTIRGSLLVFATARRGTGQSPLCRAVLGGHQEQPIWCLRFGDSCTSLVSVCRDGTLKLWDLSTLLQAVLTLTEGEQQVTTTGISSTFSKRLGRKASRRIVPSNGEHVGQNAEVMIVDGESLPSHSGAATAFAYKENFLATGGADGIVRVFKMVKGHVETSSAEADEQPEGSAELEQGDVAQDRFPPIASTSRVAYSRTPRQVNESPFVAASSATGSFNRFANQSSGNNTSRPPSSRFRGLSRNRKSGSETGEQKHRKKSKSVSKTVYNIVKANFELVAELHLSCKGISSLSFDRENDKLFVGTAVGSTVIGLTVQEREAYPVVSMCMDHGLLDVKEVSRGSSTVLDSEQESSQARDVVWALSSNNRYVVFATAGHSRIVDYRAKLPLSVKLEDIIVSRSKPRPTMLLDVRATDERVYLGTLDGRIITLNYGSYGPIF